MATEMQATRLVKPLEIAQDACTAHRHLAVARDENKTNRCIRRRIRRCTESHPPCACMKCAASSRKRLENQSSAHQWRPISPAPTCPLLACSIHQAARAPSIADRSSVSPWGCRGTCLRGINLQAKRVKQLTGHYCIITCRESLLSLY